jgi:phosphatidylserine/phosphatidylglycerophosphate/cardiolipin synthase-like enzyme
VRILEYTPVVTHAKPLVADARWSSAVGTMSFDDRSMPFNDETVLMAYDRVVGERLEAMFEADLHGGREVDVDAVRAAPSPSAHARRRRRSSRAGSDMARTSAPRRCLRRAGGARHSWRVPPTRAARRRPARRRAPRGRCAPAR